MRRQPVVQNFPQVFPGSSTGSPQPVHRVMNRLCSSLCPSLSATHAKPLRKEANGSREGARSQAARQSNPRSRLAPADGLLRWRSQMTRGRHRVVGQFENRSRNRVSDRRNIGKRVCGNRETSLRAKTEGGWLSSRSPCRRRTPNRSPGFRNALNWALLFIWGNRRLGESQAFCPVAIMIDLASWLGSPLRRLGWVINSACGHQQQEQRPLTLIFGLQAAVFASSQNGFPGRVLNPPPPSGSAPFCKYHLEHPLIDRFRIKKFRNRTYFFAPIKQTHHPPSRSVTPTAPGDPPGSPARHCGRARR
jgi:hypothetical protein